MTGENGRQGQLYGSFKGTPLEGSTIYQLTSGNIIHITEDKLRLRILENQQANEARNRWQTPVSVAVTLVATLTTATFEDFGPVKADVWQAIAIIVLLVALGFSVKYLLELLKPEKGIDDLVNAIKTSENQK